MIIFFVLLCGSLVINELLFYLLCFSLVLGVSYIVVTFVFLFFWISYHRDDFKNYTKIKCCFIHHWVTSQYQYVRSLCNLQTL